MEMSGLLWWNTSSDVHFTEFHITKYFRTYTTLKETDSFPQANAESEQQWHGQDDVLAAVQ
jgi:hypothetical protein